MKRIAIAVLVLVSVSAFAKDDAALQHLDPQTVRQLQAKLSTFRCPEGASVKACQSFKELVRSGDTSLLLSFYGFLKPKAAAVTYVVFDDDTDTFQVLSLSGHTADRAKMGVFYTRFGSGFAQVGSFNSVDFVPNKILHSSADGVDVTLDGDTVQMQVQFDTTTKEHVTITTTIKMSTLRTICQWKVGDREYPTIYTKAFQQTSE